MTNVQRGLAIAIAFAVLGGCGLIGGNSGNDRARYDIPGNEAVTNDWSCVAGGDGEWDCYHKNPEPEPVEPDPQIAPQSVESGEQAEPVMGLAAGVPAAGVLRQAPLRQAPLRKQPARTSYRRSPRTALHR